jgi:hypothetical protein
MNRIIINNANDFMSQISIDKDAIRSYPEIVRPALVSQILKILLKAIEAQEVSKIISLSWDGEGNLSGTLEFKQNEIVIREDFYFDLN